MTNGPLFAGWAAGADGTASEGPGAGAAFGVDSDSAAGADCAAGRAGMMKGLVFAGPAGERGSLRPPACLVRGRKTLRTTAGDLAGLADEAG